MNRRQRIIVSVTGIFIVLLILIGLTYAYFLTRITGNGNPTSISVTTANLELVYGDGTTAILTSSTPIEPGKFSSSKDFTVTNNGNALTDYAVTLEDFSITYANDTVIDGASVKAGTVTKMEYPEDMKMTITCVIESDNEDRNGQACGNIDGILPTENSILLTNSIEVDDIHKYVLTLTYVDSGIDQSADMNKTIKGKIDIIDPKSTIDLSGSVATYQIGDYVEINSTPIKSEIVDGKYKIIGVEPGSHTLNVKYKDTEGNVQTRGSQTLTIKKGVEASVNGNTITFTDASRIAKVNLTENYKIKIEEVLDGENSYLIYNSNSNGYTRGKVISLDGEIFDNSIAGSTPLLEVEENKTYYFTNPIPGPNQLYPTVLTFDSNKDLIELYCAPQYDGKHTEVKSFDELENSYHPGRNNGYTSYGHITIPAGVKYIAFNAQLEAFEINEYSNGFEVFRGEWQGKSYTNIYESQITGANNLKSKELYLFGDSIAAGFGVALSFARMIADANEMDLHNFAVNGAEIQATRNRFNLNMNSLNNLKENDYILIEGFINEGFGIPIGSITEIGSADFDTDTFTGNLEKLIYDYKESGIKAKLGFVLTQTIGIQASSKPAEAEKRYDAAVAVFEKYNIEYLDLRNENYELLDGIHPTQEGHLRMAESIEIWMNNI